MPSNVFSSQSTPPSRQSHSDNVSKGSLASSVNLSKGDIDYSHTILKLKGRSMIGVDHLELSIHYESNVATAATTWNQTAPTGILGLGWDLPLYMISVDTRHGPTLDDVQYSISDSGVSSTLVRQTVLPVLLELDTSLLDSAVSGDVVPENLRLAFTSNGLALSTGTVMTLQDDGSWLLVDSDLEQEFCLTTDSGVLQVCNGGETYQSQNFKFEQIVFFPRFNRWVVTDEHGTRRSFGGGVGTLNNIATSVGNSIAWDIWWAPDGSTPCWTGPAADISATHNAGDPVQVARARAWYLHSVTDRFGNGLTFEYNGFSRGSKGLLAYAEQQVSEGGIAFTKSVYLTGITDSVGRHVALSYAPKEWGSGANDFREYHDPHAARPPIDGTGQWSPTGFQDLYDVLYLDKVTVTGAAGNQLSAIDFNYTPVGNDPCAIIGDEDGDFAKRYLTEIVKYDSENTPLPGLKADYFLTMDAQGGQPGALRSITGSSGGIVSYSYTAQDIGQSNRSIEFDTDNADETNLFYGQDYVVATLFDSFSGTLRLKLLSWNGLWTIWTPADDAPFATGNINPSTLECFTGSDFVVVTYCDPAGNRYVNAWNKIAAKPGQWQPADNIIQLVINADQNIPPQFAMGTNFFVILEQGTSSPDGNGILHRYCWDWTQSCWINDSVILPQAPNWITANGSTYSVFQGADSTVRMQTYTPQNIWNDPIISEPLWPVQGYLWDQIVLTQNAAILVVAGTTPYTGSQSTQMSVLQWDETRALTISNLGVVNAYYDSDVYGASPLSKAAVVVSDSFIALNGNAFRRDGSDWNATDLFTQQDLEGVTGIAYFASQDMVGAVTHTDSAAYLTVKTWLPSSGTWDDAASRIMLNHGTNPDYLTPATASMVNQDWLIADTQVFYRGTSTNWADVINNASTALNLTDDLPWYPPEMNVASVINATPDFVAFNGQDGSDPVASIYVFDNGPTSSVFTSIAGNQIYDGGPRGQPASGGVFATCPVTTGAPYQITLNRYQDSAVTGPVVHYSVATSTLDDAMGDLSSVAYEFMASSAVCTSSGKEVSYHQATTYPGTNDPNNSPFGKTETLFINATNGVDQDNYYDLLEGQQLSKTTYTADGQAVEVDQAEWAVINQIAAGPLQPGITIPLRGGWAYQTSKNQITDCVPHSTQMTYVDDETCQVSYTGMATQRVTSRETQTGQDVFVASRLPATAICAAMWAQHNLKAVAQDTLLRFSDMSQIGDDTAGTLVAARATSWAGISANAGDDVLVPARKQIFLQQNGAQRQFPFGQENEAISNGWQLDRTFSAYSPWGQVIEDTDALGVPSAVIHSNNGLSIAGFAKNTTVSGFAGTFFDPTEDLKAYATNGSFDNDCCATGTQSLLLSSGQNISFDITPYGPQTYIAAARYRTAPGSSAGLQIDTGDQQAVWGATNGEWKYSTLPFDPAAGNPILISLTGQNGSVWVDGVYAFPLASHASFQIQHADSQTLIAKMDAGGRVTTSILNGQLQTIGSQNARGDLVGLETSGYSRRVSGTDNFDATNPNGDLKISCGEGGQIETFRDAGDWTTRWTTDGNWTAQNGTLAGAAGGSLINTDQRYIAPDAQVATTMALIEVIPDQNTAFHVTCDGMTIRWTGAALEINGATSQAGDISQCPGQWMFVHGQTTTFFFADSQLICSCDNTGVDRSLIIQADSDLSLKRLMTGFGARVGLTHKDGASRTVQVQQLWEDDCIVGNLLRDDMNRLIARTKEHPGRFQGGQDIPLLAYRPSSVNRSDFAINWSGSAAMTGDVSQYYSGQTWQVFCPTDDGGYPYFGNRFEASSRSQIVESSRPGARFAMDMATSAEDRATQQINVSHTWVYASDDAPFHLETTRSPAGVSITKTKGQMGEDMGCTLTQADNLVASNATFNTGFTCIAAPQHETTQTLPNAIGNTEYAANPAMLRNKTHDASHHQISLSEPNSGTTLSVRDAAGQVRFILPQLDSGESYALYRKYDPLGRQIEEGVLEGNWSIDSLLPYLGDPSWPLAGADPATVSGIATYDGDGTDPLALGQKVETTRITNDASGSGGIVTVTDQYSYSQLGNIAQVNRLIECDRGAEIATISYDYNALGQVRQITFPQDSSVSSIAYSYNDQGQTSAIYLNGEQDPTATYQFNPDGTPRLQTSTLGQTVSKTFGYSTDQRIIQTELTQLPSGVIHSFSCGFEDDGLMASRSLTLAGAAVDDQFGYTPQRMLGTATGTSAATYGPYDPNGNMLGISQGDCAWDVVQTPGTDKISSLERSGEKSRSMIWNARGAVLSDGVRRYDYDVATNLTTRVTYGGETVSLAYGGDGDRAQKSSALGTVCYFPGAGTAPLLRKTDAGWDVAINGPTGLIAWAGPGDIYLLETDPQNSVLLAIDSMGNVQDRHVYYPFGAANSDFTLDNAQIPYGFQGQEWDAEIELCNFNARLYDPQIGRFQSVDPALQFPSPYVFEGNTPLTQMDQTGAISQGGQIAIGASLAVVSASAQIANLAYLGASAAVGVIATVLTGGAALPLVVPAEAAIDGEDAALIEPEIAAGEAMSAAEIAKGVAKTAKNVAKGAAKGVIKAAPTIALSTLGAAASAGARYALQTPHGQFNGKDMGEAIGKGAAKGLGSAVFFSALNGGLGEVMPTRDREGKINKKSYIATIGVNIAGSVFVSDVSQIATNLIHGDDFSKGLLKSSVSGLYGGVASQVKSTSVSEISRAGGQKIGNYINSSLDAYMQALAPQGTPTLANIVPQQDSDLAIAFQDLFPNT